MPDIDKLKREVTRLVGDARELVEAAEAEGRDTLSAEELEKQNKTYARIDELRGMIGSEERRQGYESFMAAPKDTPADADMGSDEDRNEDTEAEFKSAAFDKFLKRGGIQHLTSEEARALQADSDTAGGYVVAPEQFQNELIKAVDNMTFVRGLSRTFQVPKAESLGAPVLANRAASCSWTTELAIGSEDSTMSFGKRELHPHPLAAYIKVSRTLINRAVLPVQELVNSELAYSMGITQEQGFMTGSGSQQPLGVMTASNDGISTSRDVSTGNNTTNVTFDGLKEAKYSVVAGYQPNAAWIFHRAGGKNIDKLQDSSGQYIWDSSVKTGQPDMLLGKPVYLSEYMSNTWTTGLYVGIYGDFSNYWIVDALDMQVQVLNELYAANNQIGIIVRTECDGAPVNESAFARVKLG